MHWPPWRKPFRFLCPFCGSRLFWVRVSLMRRRHARPPVITSISNGLECADCGLVTDYDDFVRQHRGWL